MTVSYFEWVQNISGCYWPLDEVYKNLDRKMTKAFHDVYRVSKDQNIHSRLAAYAVAVKRVADVMKIRGWV